MLPLLPLLLPLAPLLAINCTRAAPSPGTCAMVAA
jgi:hypothetical protein